MGELYISSDDGGALSVFVCPAKRSEDISHGWIVASVERENRDKTMLRLAFL